MFYLQCFFGGLFLEYISPSPICNRGISAELQVVPTVSFCLQSLQEVLSVGQTAALQPRKITLQRLRRSCKQLYAQKIRNVQAFKGVFYFNKEENKAHLKLFHETSCPSAAKGEANGRIASFHSALMLFFTASYSFLHLQSVWARQSYSHFALVR